MSRRARQYVPRRITPAVVREPEQLADNIRRDREAAAVAIRDAQEAADDTYVNETGDTMTGDLVIAKATAGLQLTSTTDTSAELTFSVLSALRWLVRAGSSAADLLDAFIIYRRSAGAWVKAFQIGFTTGISSFETHLYPLTTALYDLGAGGNEWRNASFTGTVNTTRLTGDNLATTVQAKGNVSGIVACGFDSGAIVTMTLTGNVTLTFTGTMVLSGGLYTFVITQDGTGGRTVTWPAGIVWEGGVAYPAGVAGQRDVVELRYIGGGTYLGSYRTAFA